METPLNTVNVFVIVAPVLIFNAIPTISSSFFAPSDALLNFFFLLLLLFLFFTVKHQRETRCKIREINKRAITLNSKIIIRIGKLKKSGLFNV